MFCFTVSARSRLLLTIVEVLPYLIEPCLHNLCRLFRKVTSLACLSMLILVVARHKVRRNVALIWLCRKARLTILVLFWTSISDRISRIAVAVSHRIASCRVWTGSRLFSVKGRRGRIHGVRAHGRSAGAGSVARLSKAVSHLSRKRIRCGASEGIPSWERWLDGRLICILILTRCVFVSTSATRSGRSVLRAPGWAAY